MTTEISTSESAAAVTAQPMHVVFIFDRSGSMAGHEQDVIGGFNTYVEGLRQQVGEVGVSYVMFDTTVYRVWIDVDLPQVPSMTSAHYQPRGGTALYDAVGQTVAALKDNPDHAFVVITHTDGEENSSHEWTADKLKALIAERTALGNWTFVFFGQAFEQWNAERTSGGMAMAAGNTMSYAHGAGAATADSASRTANVMRAANINSTQFYAGASAAAASGASDEEIAEILRGKDSNALFSD